ncbi:MAG: NUDIX domain-containing protein [Chromatiaceae bacterium]|jgi:ADP-ribose pyrophosphatase|nr:NUDIX domain-containing protein [Chromatiaceae bacterium]
MDLSIGRRMKKEYEIVSDEAVFRGFFKMNRYRLRHSSFHGGWCGEIVRERIEHLAAVSVLLYDPDLDVLVLVEQFRVGLMGNADPPWSLETVSGFCDTDHEAAEEVARREVVEETDCTLKALTHVGEFFVSPGMSVERINLYCGWVDASRAGGIHGLDHEGEELRVVTMSRSEALGALFGRLRSTSIIMALQWLEANRPRLLTEWGWQPA